MSILWTKKILLHGMASALFLLIMPISSALATDSFCSHPTTTSTQQSSCGCGSSFAYNYKNDGSRDVVYWRTSDIPVNINIATTADLMPGGSFVRMQTKQQSCFNVYSDMGYVPKWSSYYYNIFQTDSNLHQDTYFTYRGTYGCGAGSVWTKDSNGNLRCITFHGRGWTSGYEMVATDYVPYSLGVNTLETCTPYWSYTTDMYGNCVRWSGDPSTQHIGYSYLIFGFGSSLCDSYLPDSFKSDLVDRNGNPVSVPDSSEGRLVKVCKVVHEKCDCDLKITSFTGDDGFLPYTGGLFELRGTITDTSGKPISWTINVAGKSYSGSGASPGIVWDGKDSSGKIVKAGPNSATLTAKIDDQCKDSKPLKFIVKEAPPGQCGLYVDFGSSANISSGNLSHSQELFSSRGVAMPTGITLYYNSLDPANGALGRSWSHSYDYSFAENSDGSVLISEPNWKYAFYTLSNGSYSASPGNYSTLVKNTDGTFTLTQKDGQIYTYVNGKITTITGRTGNTTTFTYSGDNLESVRDPSERTITFSYDTANHLTSIIDPSGNTYVFTVGSTLTSVTQPDNGAWQYTYDANAFMLSKTDPLNNVTNYAYDDNHRVVSSTDPEGRTRSIAYPETQAAVKSTTFIEKDGGAWTYSYDTQNGYLLGKTDPQGGTTSYSYDSNGNRTATTGPDGTTTTATYDNTSNMLTSTDAMGQTSSYTYNSFGQALSVTDAQGGTTTYGYDTKGNMTSLTDPAGTNTKYEYDAKGNVTRVIDPTGQATSFTYDSQGSLASVTDPAGATTVYTSDTAGNVISITDVKGAVTQFVYDSRNRLTKIIDPNGNATTYSYDANGNKTSDTDANGNVTRYEYNSRNQLIKTIDALGHATTYSYGGSSCPSCGGGNGEKLTSLVDANGNVTSYLYDKLGHLETESDPLGTTTYAYDARGNLTAKTDANGNTITYSYDPNGRLLKKTYPDRTEETFSYDAKGNILTANNRHISYILSYDEAGRMRNAADSTGKVISYEYDILGNKTKMISPEGKSLIYTYDKANRLTSIINGGAFTFSYDGRGQRSSLTYPNGDTAAYGYDKQGSLTSLVRKSANGSIISSNSYTLDNIGNRQTNTTPDRTSAYSYDPVYRLIQALTNTPGSSSNTKATKGTGNAVQQQKDFFSYDPVGNRLTDANNRGYAYGPGNQLISENGTTYNYDKNGNLTRKSSSTETTFYSWDYENRLVKVTTPTAAAEYAYDSFGRRIEKKTIENGANTTTKFFYDNQSILFDYDETGAIGNRYIHGPNIDEPLAVTTGKDKYYYHADGLGSIVAMTDASGKMAQTYEYDSFGNLKDQMNRVKQPLTYTGREWDKETGLLYLRNRYYDPMEGRFISKDPIGFNGGINLYNYVGSNVINRSDPFGFFGPGGPGSEYPGHGDFSGCAEFDYNLEDNDPSTRPIPIFGDPERHFRDLPPSEVNVSAAISSCDKDAFQRAMHRGQDYFSHYSKGYRWKPFACWKNLGLGHGFDGSKPDHDVEAWDRAEAWTKIWLKKWNDKCQCKE